jgi:hypothetical protein
VTLSPFAAYQEESLARRADMLLLLLWVVLLLC